VDKFPGFICDIDGTLADHTGLRGHYEYSKVSGDKPIESSIFVARLLIDHSGLDPVFVTGRADENDGQVRRDTVEWLRNHVTDKPFSLFMRAETLRTGKRDFRPDFEVKGEIYDKWIEPKWDIKFAMDDRLQVCQMWHRIGIPVFRVGDPDAVF
jgi:hypothetical protein